MTVYIWDLDGTLVDSYPAIVPATQKACTEFGLEFSAEYIHSEIIRTSVGAFIEQEAVPRQMNPDPIKARFNELNDNSIGNIVAMPHAKEILQRLTEAGHSCFMVTHRGESCLRILRQTELHRDCDFPVRISPQAGSGCNSLSAGEIQPFQNELLLRRRSES